MREGHIHHKGVATFRIRTGTVEVCKMLMFAVRLFDYGRSITLRAYHFEYSHPVLSFLTPARQKEVSSRDFMFALSFLTGNRGNTGYTLVLFENILLPRPVYDW